MAVYEPMPPGWRLHNVTTSGTPSWVKTFELEHDAATAAKLNAYAKNYGAVSAVVERARAKYLRKVIVALDPWTGKWFWRTTGTLSDEGKGDGFEYDDPVACAVVCEMTFGSTKSYEPVKRNERWQGGTI